MAGLGLITTVVVAASQATPQQDSSGTSEQVATTPATQAAAKHPGARVSVPPLPSVGFAPVRPMDVVRATYDFAAQHPEILKYVPCYCGCGSQGHKANESCFVARRDAKGNVLEWDTHGFGCAICVDVARESMQLYASGADVVIDPRRDRTPMGARQRRRPHADTSTTREEVTRWTSAPSRSLDCSNPCARVSTWAPSAPTAPRRSPPIRT